MIIDETLITMVQILGHKINNVNFEDNDDNEIILEILQDIRAYTSHNEINNLLKERKSKILINYEAEREAVILSITKGMSGEVNDAMISLNTQDFIAYLIGKKKEIYELKKFVSQEQNPLLILDDKLNRKIIKKRLVLEEETELKIHVPVNYALSYFFNHPKEIALSKFKDCIRNDRESRLESTYVIEYYEIFDLFFKRLQLDFIPQIIDKNLNNLIEFENSNNQYVSKDEIFEIINKENHFGDLPFSVPFDNILNNTNLNLKNRTHFKESLYLFFNNLHIKKYNKALDYKYINILIICFTHPRPHTEFNDGKGEYIISDCQILLSRLLMENSAKNFLFLLMRLCKIGVFYKAPQKLSTLCSLFFCQVKNFSYSTCLRYIGGSKIAEPEGIFSDDLEKYLRSINV